MRIFIIDTRHMCPELQGGLIGVAGSRSPSPQEKNDCIETVSRYAMDGWAITADPFTPIGQLAALTAEAACAPFLNLRKLLDAGDLHVSGPTDNRLIDSGGVGHGID
jgi:hypothetical protein